MINNSYNFCVGFNRSDRVKFLDKNIARRNWSLIFVQHSLNITYLNLFFVYPKHRRTLEASSPVAWSRESAAAGARKMTRFGGGGGIEDCDTASRHRLSIESKPRRHRHVQTPAGINKRGTFARRRKDDDGRYIVVDGCWCCRPLLLSMGILAVQLGKAQWMMLRIFCKCC